ncbi:hypothetical protein HOF92_07600, partial [bacterium]|nr:hypothetical protein [bacterium]
MFFVLFFLVLLFPRADCHFFLLKELEAPPGSLTLAQLGHLSCSDPGTQKAYKTIAEKMRLATIFPSSPPILWNRGYLLKKWEQFHREKPILIAGAQEIQIRPSAVTVSRDEFRALVEEEILKSLPQDLDYKIQIRDFPSKIDLPGDQYRIEFLTDRISRGHLRVKFFHEDRLLKQFFLNFKVLTRQGGFK